MTDAIFIVWLIFTGGVKGTDAVAIKQFDSAQACESARVRVDNSQETARMRVESKAVGETVELRCLPKGTRP